MKDAEDIWNDFLKPMVVTAEGWELMQEKAKQTGLNAYCAIFQVTPEIAKIRIHLQAKVKRKPKNRVL